MLSLFSEDVQVNFLKIDFQQHVIHFNSISCIFKSFCIQGKSCIYYKPNCISQYLKKCRTSTIVLWLQTNTSCYEQNAVVFMYFSITLLLLPVANFKIGHKKYFKCSGFVIKVINLHRKMQNVFRYIYTKAWTLHSGIIYGCHFAKRLYDS